MYIVGFTSIGLFSVVWVCMVFAFDRLDRYVDNRKTALRTSLVDAIEGDATLVAAIQELGKASGGEQRLQQALASQPDKLALLDEFARHIGELRARREQLQDLGLWHIRYWLALAVVTILIFALTQGEPGHLVSMAPPLAFAYGIYTTYDFLRRTVDKVPGVNC